jgi:hypothetical protein
MTTNLKSSPSVLPTSMLNSEAFINQLRKSYQVDQQVKYLHLQAEIDLLLHQLQNLKQARRL